MGLSKLLCLSLIFCSTSAFADEFFEIKCNDHKGNSIFSSIMKTSEANITANDPTGFSVHGISQLANNYMNTSKRSLDNIGVDTSSCDERGKQRVFVFATEEKETTLFCASGQITKSNGDLEAYVKNKFSNFRKCVFLIDSEKMQELRN